MKKAHSRMLAVLMTLVMLFSTLPTMALAADPADFAITPYVLAPETDGMTVAWEADAEVTATISLGTTEGGADVAEDVAVAADPDAPSFEGEQMVFFSHCFDGLEEDTLYYYTVKLDSGAVEKGSFKTLPLDPTELKVLFITDSHQFATREVFNEYVYSYDPDFILHTGDIPSGVGTQKNQFTYWLNTADFLKDYPVVYAPGNHDYGEFYTEYFGKAQGAAYTAQDASGSNYSFNYGGVHFVMMDSNPWGLMQMNIETAGGTISADLKATIADAMAWLEEDLQSEAAKNADFRVVGMHHPHSDVYMQKHVPAILESNNVDLFLGGHTHGYVMNASANPAVGAGTTYVCGQSAGDFSAAGGWAEINIADGLLTVNNIGNAADGTTNVVNTVVLAQEKQQLAFSDVSVTPTEIQSNDTITVTATVTNEGNGLAAAVFPIDDNGEIQYIYALSKDGAAAATHLLNAGESLTLTGTLRISEMGDHALTLGDNEPVTVKVNFREAEHVYSNIRVKLGEGSAYDLESDVLNAKADIWNMGNESGMTTAVLKINGEKVESKQYKLDANETAVAEFQYQIPRAGKYNVSIGTEDDAQIVTKSGVVIEGSIQGMPLVYDKTDNENVAYIHGAPELGVDENGKTALVLNAGANLTSYFRSTKDYIEIPDNGSTYTNDGLTAMVWANLEQGANPAVLFDHHPLMVKGPSVSNGINYLFRMVIRNTGKIAYGVGFDNENGEFHWLDDGDPVAVGEWKTYTNTFDRVNGGYGYHDDVVNAYIEAPDFAGSDLTNWEGESFYVGMAHMAALKRGRGPWNTALSGTIGQLRFYTDSMEQSEISYLLENPAEAGESADSMAFWFDFEEINEVGTHTTEWVALSGAKTLDYIASIGGASAIKAVVEVSDDKSEVKASKVIDLADGTASVDLSDLESGEYVRIVTTFISDLNDTESFVPVLKEYVLASETDEVVWNTAASFAKGTFEDAVAHQSEDFYAENIKDFDNYSGEATDPYVPSSRPSRPSKPVVEEEESKTFSDVHDVDHWAEKAIDYVVAEGIFNGTSETTFSPDASITRSQLMNVLARHSGDVSSKAAMSKGIEWAIKNGISDGSNPNAPITRQQLVTMLWRYAKLMGEDVSVGEETNILSYNDAFSVSEYAIEAMQWACGAGVVSGYANGNLAPGAQATRAHMATFMMRYLEYVK